MRVSILLSHEFLPLVPKQPFNLGIDQHYFALLIHHDHGIRSTLQKPTKYLLALPRSVVMLGPPIAHSDISQRLLCQPRDF